MHYYIFIIIYLLLYIYIYYIIFYIIIILFYILIIRVYIIILVVPSLSPEVVSVCGSEETNPLDPLADPMLGSASSLDHLNRNLSATIEALNKRCFLSAKAAPVLALIEEVMSLMHLFHDQVTAHHWIRQVTTLN